MEGSVARWYEKTTRKDMGQFERLAERLAGRAASRVGRCSKWLPVLASYRSNWLAPPSTKSLPSMISKTFVEIARKNAAEAGVQVDFPRGKCFGTCPLRKTASTCWSAARPSRTSPSRRRR